MDKQTQVDGAIGSESGGSQSVGQVDGTVRERLNEQLSKVFTKEAGADVSVSLGAPGFMVVETKPRAAFRAAMEFGRAAGLSIVRGDYDPIEDTNWVIFAYGEKKLTALAASPAQAPGLSNTEGTADQSDSTKEEA